MATLEWDKPVVEPSGLGYVYSKCGRYSIPKVKSGGVLYYEAFRRPPPKKNGAVFIGSWRADEGRGGEAYKAAREACQRDCDAVYPDPKTKLADDSQGLLL